MKPMVRTALLTNFYLAEKFTTEFETSRFSKSEVDTVDVCETLS